MKHLFFTLLFSASLAAFSQNISYGMHYKDSVITGTYSGSFGQAATPDTLRAIILATMCRKCAAEAIRGYVVIEQGKRPVYLNRCKKALKLPQVGGYEIVNSNKKSNANKRSF